DRMLIKIAELELDDDIAALGAGKILKTLRQAHKDYGLALGITTVEKAPRTKNVREALGDLMDSIRNYVVQATAIQRKKDPNSLELPERLPQPIAEFESQTRGGATAAGDGAPHDPAAAPHGAGAPAEGAAPVPPPPAPPAPPPPPI